MQTPTPPELRAGALRLALRPDIGGCVAGLWHGSLPVLRSVEPANVEGPRLAGSFPLVPYSNRLGYRRFRWQGADYTTQPNFLDNPHSLHGVGWHRAWQVVSCTASQAELRLDHAPDADWPFAFEARQVFTLDEAGDEAEEDQDNPDSGGQEEQESDGADANPEDAQEEQQDDSQARVTMEDRGCSPPCR